MELPIRVRKLIEASFLHARKMEDDSVNKKHEFWQPWIQHDSGIF